MNIRDMIEKSLQHKEDNFCPDTGKTRIYSIDQFDRGKNGVNGRVYRCAFCRGWHSTTVPLKSKNTQIVEQRQRNGDFDLLYFNTSERYAQKNYNYLLEHGARVKLVKKGNEYQVRLK